MGYRRHTLGIFLLVGSATSLLHGSSIDITTSPPTVIEQQLSIDFGVWNYGSNNPTSSPYPTGLGFTLLGERPGDDQLASSGSVYGGYLFFAELQSLDGSVSVPVLDPIAIGLGYDPGFLLLRPGTVAAGGGLQQVGLLSGQIQLSPEQSVSLFGSNIGNYSNAATLQFVNLGHAWTLGLPGSSIKNSVMISNVSGAGPVSTGGIVGEVRMVHNPEPETWALIVIGIVGLAARRKFCHQSS